MDKCAIMSLSTALAQTVAGASRKYFLQETGQDSGQQQQQLFEDISLDIIFKAQRTLQPPD